LLWSRHDTATGTQADTGDRQEGKLMILLINRRYPMLGAVLGFIAALAFIAVGVHTHHSILIIMGAISVVLAIVRGTAKAKHHGTQAAR
jgi:uncharacterized membrane protein